MKDVATPAWFLRLKGARGRGLGRWALALVVAGLGLGYPAAQQKLAQVRVDARLVELAARLPVVAEGTCRGIDFGSASDVLSVRTQRLGSLLSGWQTIGGCGAGGSGSATAVKWIGRGVHGGLFSVTQSMSYLHLYNEQDKPEPHEFYGGYNVTSTTQIGLDLSEKWGASVVIPLVYKYYRNFLPNPVIDPYDVSNGGLGDMSLVLLRKFGDINDTIATFSLGLPTGKHKAFLTDAGAYVTQEKQLGFGRPNATLNVDHVFDQIWGIIVAGGLVSYRGGKNDLESYRAPSAGAFAYAGYYMGRFVPSLGVAFTGFKGHDVDRNATQLTPLFTAAPIAAIEWANDYVAFLLGGALPFGTSFGGQYAMLPWTVSLGISLSPF